LDDMSVSPPQIGHEFRREDLPAGTSLNQVAGTVDVVTALFELWTEILAVRRRDQLVQRPAPPGSGNSQYTPVLLGRRRVLRPSALGAIGRSADSASGLQGPKVCMSAAGPAASVAFVVRGPYIDRVLPMTLRTIATVVGGSLPDGSPDTLVTGPARHDFRSIGPQGRSADGNQRVTACHLDEVGAAATPPGPRQEIADRGEAEILAVATRSGTR
jgi:hypothetical protein